MFTIHLISYTGNKLLVINFLSKASYNRSLSYALVMVHVSAPLHVKTSLIKILLESLHFVDLNVNIIFI